MMISPTLIAALKDFEKDLLPEQKRAMEAMRLLLPDWTNYFQDICQLNDLCKQGHKFFTSSSLQTADLPKGKTWQWNQSRSKKKLSVPNTLDISFCKLNTRKSRGCTERSPSYKVWIFQLQFIQEDTILYFSWCEKGVPAIYESTPKQQSTQFLSYCGPEQFMSAHFYPDPIEQITLNDLSFLKEFTDICTAHQLGWVQ